MSDNSNEVEVKQDLEKASGSYSDHEYELGLRVVNEDAVADPGLEPHRVRMTDKSEKHEKAAVRQVALLLSLIHI
jgi:ubiquinol-cytochrome c reductase iron-sulfur subunit